LAYADSALGIRIEEHDDHALFLEAATWLGTPYVAGGTTRNGVDCSGLTMAIYARIYDKQLHRRSVEQYEWDVQLKERCQLQQGDLVFFRTPNSSEQCDHVGIFLKDDKVHPRWWSWS
jgi:gamma-DL-glutamyl hydrolase